MLAGAVGGPAENRGVPEPTFPATATQTVTLRAPLSAFDHWELEEQLRHVDRVLSGARFTAQVETPKAAQTTAVPTAAGQATVSRAAQATFAPANDAASTHDAAANDNSGDEAASTQSKRRRFVHPRHNNAPRSRLTWTVVVAGGAALACGIGLLVYGWLLHRPDLQSIGLPITLLGQGAVLSGMLLQLDRVWRDNRRTDDKLSKFQRQLEYLEGLAADLQGLTPRRRGVFSRPTQQRTLADLKERLETLSHRLNSPSS